jgi:hypothetical protein
MSIDDIDGFQQRLQVYRRTLAHYLQQCAMLGDANVPPSIVHGIEDARDQIRHIKTTLRSWDVQVLDHPDDQGRIDFTSPERLDKVRTPTRTNPITINSLLAGKSAGQKLALAVLVSALGALLGAIGSYAFAIGRVLNTKVAPVGWASTALLSGSLFGAIAMMIVILLYLILRWIAK